MTFVNATATCRDCGATITQDTDWHGIEYWYDDAVLDYNNNGQHCDESDDNEHHPDNEGNTEICSCPDDRCIC